MCATGSLRGRTIWKKRRIPSRALKKPSSVGNSVTAGWETTPSARRQGSQLLQDLRSYAGVAGLGIAFGTGPARASRRGLEDRQRLAEDASRLLPLARGEQRFAEVLQDDRIPRREVLGAGQLGERRRNLS